MQGVVSLLDGRCTAEVREIWRELERKFGLRGAYAAPFPHFSYHVAEGYDTEGLSNVLSALASTLLPFRVQTTGLGLFTGPHPVIYIPVVRNRDLDTLHSLLWETVGSSATDVSTHYSPDRWIPHISLAVKDLLPAQVPAVMAYLSERTYDWEIGIDNLSLGDTDPTQEKLLFRIAFAGSG